VLPVLLGGACGSTDRAPTAVNLIDELPNAERRAGSLLSEAVRTDTVGAGTDEARALVTRAPARVIWQVKIVPHAHLRTAVALVPDVNSPSGPLGAGVTIRVGIADTRNYEELARVSVLPRAPGAPFWQSIDLDLKSYGGWQWSLFYRPWTITWRLNFSIDALPGAGTVAWKEPVIGS